VRAVAAIYRRLLEAAPAGEAFNVCSGTAYTLADVLRMMATIAGYAIAVRVNPAFVRANEVKRLLGSAAKLERAIGTLPRVPLEETLRWMYGIVE
jgi:nucleoside-diphosphate-sugar epimerase